MMTLQSALSVLSGEQEQKLTNLKSIVASNYPMTLRALRLVDVEYTTTRQYNGFNLVKRPSKKMGFVYYVRYWHKKGMLPSKWCTHTNDYEKACEFARQNRDVIIARYLEQTGGNVVRFFKNFYNPNGKIYKAESMRGGELSDDRIKKFQRIMDDKFVPFLKEKRIAVFDEITVPVLDDFQDYLLARGMKAQSVNSNMPALSAVFKYLIRKGFIKENPCQSLLPVPERPEEKKTHGCYKLNIMRGVFEKRWKDKFVHLLNLIIYTTGMRNIEIESFCKDDIIDMSGVHFISLKRSKTKNGIRLVPLHPFVYKKIIGYAKEMKNQEYIFGNTSLYWFVKACEALGKMLGYDAGYLKEKNITFYSGRHFWKTMMSDGGLGEESEEFFMGHKITRNVKKLYDHDDAKGEKYLVKKAKEVFKILDAVLFIKK